MPQGGTIQLLPESRRKLEIKLPGEDRPVYLGLAVLILFGAVFLGLKLYTSFLSNNLNEINQKIDLLEQKRDKNFEQDVLLLNKRFSLAGNLITGHVIWSNALAKIQALTPAQSQLTTLVADTQAGKIDIKGVAANYTVVAKQIAGLLADGSITDIELNKIVSVSSGLLEYDMKLVFDRNKFLLNQK